MNNIRLSLDELLFIYEIPPLELEQAFVDSDGDQEKFQKTAKVLFEQHRTNVVLPLLAKVLRDDNSEDLSVSEKTRMVKCMMRERLEPELIMELIDGEEDKKLRFAMFESLHPDGIEVAVPDKKRVERCKECVVGFGGTNVLEITIMPVRLTSEDIEDLNNRLEDENLDPIDILMDLIGKHQEIPPEFRDVSPSKGKQRGKKGGLTDMFGVKPSEN